MSKFLMSWDMHGLETIIDLGPLIDDIEHTERELLFKRVMAPEDQHVNPARGKLNGMLNMIMLRARMNSQRHYEIYVIDTTDDVDESDIRRLFEDDPQAGADLIRERGVKIFSDRIERNNILIQ